MRVQLFGIQFVLMALVCLPVAGFAQIECATFTVTDQQITPDPGGDGAICTLSFCLSPPQYYWPETTVLFFALFDGIPGAPASILTGLTAPEGWNAGPTEQFPDHGGGWWGPHIEEPLSGFGLTVHAPPGLSGFWIEWMFQVLEDGLCGDMIYVDLNPTAVQEGSWGRIKTLFR